MAAALVLSFAAVLFPLASPATANHGARTLQIGHCENDPPAGGTCPEGNDAIVANELDENDVQQLHTIVAILSTAADGGSGDINVDFEIESGPGDISGGAAGGPGNTPNFPDLTCTVPAGSTRCRVQYTSQQTGDDQIRAWIDHDKNDATADPETYDGAEGRVADNTTDCGDTTPDPSGECVGVPTAGSKPEPDGTDVIRKTWEEGDPARLDCDPETATNPATGSGSSETYTCSVTDAAGNAVSGVEIEGENRNGPNDPDNADANPPDYDHQTSEGGHFCTTGSDGTCSDTIESIDGETGTATICFWADTDSDDTYNPGGTDQNDGGDCDQETQPEEESNDLTDTVTKTWQARTASGVDAEPETATNDPGDDHEITATVYDQFGDEFESGTTVKFELFQGSPSDSDGNDPSPPDDTCTTNNSSECSITYTSEDEGRDRWCVWINNEPAMSGDNNNGTCDGESLNDPDDAADSADAPEPANDDQDVVEKNWEDQAAASRLNCEPETDTNSAGSSHTITCTATNAGGQRVSGTRVDAEATGANDPDNGDSPTSPDFSCTTVQDDPLTPTVNEAGTCSFTHGGNTNQTGLTTYRAWIDSDNQNSTVEADSSEGRDEANSPGQRPEPDNTDVVEKSWVPAPTSITMTPESDTANIGTCNPYTITARNAQNQGAQGATIDVEQRHDRANNNTNNDEPRVSFCTPPSGPNPSDVDTSRGDLTENPDNLGTAGGETVNTTDNNGQITIGIKIEPANNSDGTGNVTITAWWETDDDDDPEDGEPKDTSTKTWVKPEGRTIDCEPETSTGNTGEPHTVTCTVRDRDGQPAPGEGVTFTEDGPGQFSTPTQTTTNEQGQASATVNSDEGGTQTITGTITDDNQGNEPNEVDECDRAANDPSGAPAGVCSDSVTRTWVAPDEPQCNDDDDNDGDGKTDFPDDPGCDSEQDNSESPNPECSDGQDNDGDEDIDFPADDGCENERDSSEETENPEKDSQNSRVTIDYGNRSGDFSGKVKSDPNERCEARRIVRVKKKRPGRDATVGRTRTNRRGGWRIPENNADGAYYAKVQRKAITVNDAGDKLVCEADRSGVIRV